jgi:hypothetical protein
MKRRLNINSLASSTCASCLAVTSLLLLYPHCSNSQGQSSPAASAHTARRR